MIDQNKLLKTVAMAFAAFILTLGFYWRVVDINRADFFLFDENRKLVYRGRINDNWQDPSKVSRHDLDDALFAVASGKEVLKEQLTYNHRYNNQNSVD